MTVVNKFEKIEILLNSVLNKIYEISPKSNDILYINNKFYFLPTHFYILNTNDIRISGKQIKLTIDAIDKNKVIEKKITTSVFILDQDKDILIFKLQNYFILEKLSKEISINNFDF